MFGSAEFGLEPAHDLASRGAPGLWQVEGGDPFFLLKPARRRTLKPGAYEIVAIGGEDLDRLTSAAIYLDSGAGFNEAEKALVVFVRDSEGRWKGRVRIEAPVRALRFDPSDGDQRPAFALRGLTFTLIAATHGASRAAADAPKVLLNLVRLLPGEHGAGGAGRVCHSLIAALADRVKLRVAIPHYHSRLAAIYPAAEFVIVPSDDHAHLGPHLDWCDCFVDPLNALRPKTIEARVPVIAILQDLQHMRLPQFFPATERRARGAEYGYAAARANTLVAISDYERENLRAYYGRGAELLHYAGFMAEDSKLSEADVRAARASAKTQTPYLIYPAVPWLHKNHEILVQAIALLRQSGRDVSLAMTNTRGKAGHGARISELSDMLGVADLVERKAFLPERELLDLTLNAAGMMFPSLYEGFGIPLTDAMQLGVPILAARAAASPEICGEAAAYFSNPRNAISVASDIAAFIDDEARRARLAEAGLLRAKDFSSEKVGREFAAIVERTIARAKTDGGEVERATPQPATPFFPLAALVIYAGLDEAQIETLCTVPDIEALHRATFGASARVTVALDIALARDARLVDLFAKAERLILFDVSAPRGLAHAVEDFSLRYDDAALHVVTRYPDCVQRTTPQQMRAIEMALDLHPLADCAIAAPGVADCALHEAPSEIDGVLAYERARRDGPVVFDVVFRRDALGDAPHGAFAFLAAYATKARRLLVPEARRP